MEQKKIGLFIAELRKEQELTQQQLADSLGVSNKTISKWECGNSMPDISSILPLCEILNITINELISGERLTPDNYPQKAEEHMIHFIKQEENRLRKMNPFSLLLIVLSILSLCCFTIFTCNGVTLWLTTGILISGLLYGFIGYLILLPIETKLDILLKKYLI